LINFIIVTCKIWRKIGLGHKTLIAETETLTILVEMRRWYVSRPRRRDRDHNPVQRCCWGTLLWKTNLGPQFAI